MDFSHCAKAIIRELDDWIIALKDTNTDIRIYIQRRRIWKKTHCMNETTERKDGCVRLYTERFSGIVSIEYATFVSPTSSRGIFFLVLFLFEIQDTRILSIALHVLWRIVAGYYYDIVRPL